MRGELSIYQTDFIDIKNPRLFRPGAHGREDEAGA